ncbi:porin [Tenacibaculum maritimum]|uniref:porin n=1 Tax=Tenacibaculum maritimum TaxID=107401 RepID=UPI0004659ED8|nr:porin [Tenacibaculum maritimum]MCD9562562.1 OprO/OprP family phosphate-selective porin [Tenacibaculum maritimum]MCD9565990.1 OprO/OprP family phosphate-selective porin [Tenacibaculum maritimum]MCD9577733.1 OprO/OprP family phosphate-selective porin [Tenacibaculum maritimum]MCD9584890.1 OprO/OprP family phosphate-selective porin [Tenacibaculum maritimum]MCD9596710.1 OprO/OprP family phosphate-selective porin [Tenacibaculum maritimum]
MKFKTLLTSVSMLMLCSMQAQQKQSPKFGKGLFNLVGKENSWSMNIGARMQFLTIAKWDSDADGLSNPSSSFLVRRARLKFNGFAFSPTLKYKLELGLTNNDIGGVSEFTNNAPRYILDAVVKWNFYHNFELWAGQTKLPGNRERVVSSGNLQLVDRSLLNSRFNIDRDLGLQLRHHFRLSKNIIVKEVLSIAQGEGRNITTGNLGGHQYTARVEVLPFGEFSSKGDYKGGDLKREKKPKLAIGGSYDFNNNAVKNRSNQGSYMKNDIGFYETNITTVFVDAMFKYKGFSFMGEYAYRDAKDPIAKNSDGSLTGDQVQVGSGVNLQTGYLFPSNWELSGRYTNISLDKAITAKNPENQYTLGLSKYVAGHKLKIQTDVSYLDLDIKPNQLMYRLQVDIHF